MNYRKNRNKKTSLLAALFISASMSLSAHNFESSVPATLSVESGLVSLSTNHFKDGNKSLKWDWNKGNSVLTFTDAVIKNNVSSFDNRSGITFWVYNEVPQTKPLKFDFLDEQGRIQYTFDFNLDFTGWRAGWIAYKDMWTTTGESPVKKYVSVLKINSPAGISSGTVYLDRLNFVKSVDRQATPDAQIPDNNRHLDREIWHWGLLHKWNSQPYDLPLTVPSSVEQKEMDDISASIKTMLKGRALSSSDRSTLSALVAKVRLTPDGGGAPLMLNDSVKSGDISFTQLNQLLDLSARGWYIDNNESDKQTFISAVKYALDQGFAYESGMGTNHHYGYFVREIFGAIWWMQDVLTATNLWDDAYRMVSYWSGLAECRQPFNPLRDEITDSWNTLILPKLACAAMNTDDQQRLRDLRSLSRWVSGSLCITPGTIGGIKVDGTIFHHGGHYPAYGIPGLAYVGKYLSCVNGTSFTITDEARDVMKLALTASRNYSNLRSWGLAQSGRNPFNGDISPAGATAFGYAAQAGKTLDRELAADFMRMKEGQRLYTADNNLINAFKAAGVTAASSPQGFYIYNYSNLGTYRYNDQMVTLKGLSNTLWGSEIYSQNNRYGRYQSYGSVLIIGTRTPDAIENGYPVTEAASRFTENGWDWNRIPGTTTIHLPFDKLNSPNAGTLMLRQKERFAGSSSLEGKYGMFVLKLGEMDYTNFTGDFTARKSVFCVGNKLVCVGSDISNTNSSAPTETTLFQQSLLNTAETIEVDGIDQAAFPYSPDLAQAEDHLLRDVTGTSYYIPAGQDLVVSKSLQTSKENKTMKNTNGNFAVAYLNHGTAPQKAQYEYLIMLEAASAQIEACKKGDKGYQLLTQTRDAHIVYFPVEGVRGYAFFETYSNDKDPYVLQSDAETMVMLRQADQDLKLSICSPDINQTQHEYTNPQESQPVQRTIRLKGEWEEKRGAGRVSLSSGNGYTDVTVTCQHGQPVEVTLSPLATSTPDADAQSQIKIYRSQGSVMIQSPEAMIGIYNFQGQQILKQQKGSGEIRVPVNFFPVIVKVTTLNSQRSQKVM